MKYKNSIFRKLVLVFILLVVLPALFLGVYLIQRDLREETHKAYNDTMAALELRAQDIQTRASQVEHAAQLLSTRTAIQNAMIRRNQSYADMAINLLYNVREEVNETAAYLSNLDAGIVLITKHEDVPEVFDLILHQGQYLSRADFISFWESPEKSAWGMPDVHGPDFVIHKTYDREMKFFSIPYYLKVYIDVQDFCGIIKCSVDPALLFHSLLNWNSEYPIMVERNGEIIFSSGNEDAEFNDSKEHYAILPIPDMGMNLVTHIPLPDTGTILETLTPSILLIILFAIMLLIFLRLTQNRILGGLKTVNRALSHIESGNDDIRLPDSGNDEIGVLFQAFNRLMDGKQEQTQHLIEQEQTIHRAQILALQCQMNPHFLFNSLNWLQLMIELNKNPQNTSDAIAYLSSVLHYNMATSPLSTVEEEIQNLSNYLQFMNIREKSEFHLEIECPDALYDLPLMRFTLQPIVENAIRHGRSAERPLLIRLEFEENESNIRIRVMNDGSPPTDEELIEINRRIREETEIRHTGLGLYNLSKRLRILYGEGTLSMYTTGAFTVVELNIRRMPKENDL